jgi:thioredoxin 1
MAQLQEVTDATFEQQVIEATGPVLVDFWGAWCPPCRALTPVLEAIAQEQAGKLTILKLDIDLNERTTMRYGVMSFPTVKQMIGARPKSALMRDLAPFLAQEAVTAVR